MKATLARMLARVARIEPPTSAVEALHGVDWVSPSLHRCPAGAAPRSALDWSFIDHAFCISLRERQDRAIKAADEFQRVGLASKTSFYRPSRGVGDTAEAIWNSHREVARTALAMGCSQVAIFEDDVEFTSSFAASTLERIARNFATLPADWEIFFLGHWPLKATRISRGLYRTSSGCAHAYVANRGLLEWLAASDYPSYRALHARTTVGRGIDGAYARSKAAYAVFPMVAIQNDSVSDHVAANHVHRVRRLRHLVTRTRLREWMLSRFMRPNEYLVVGIGHLRSLFAPR